MYIKTDLFRFDDAGKAYLKDKDAKELVKNRVALLVDKLSKEEVEKLTKIKVDSLYYYYYDNADIQKKVVSPKGVESILNLMNHDENQAPDAIVSAVKLKKATNEYLISVIMQVADELRGRGKTIRIEL